MPRFGLVNSLAYEGPFKAFLRYVTDGLKLYMPYKQKADPLQFVGEGSCSFDGSNDYVSIGDSNDFSFGDGSNDSAFSISSWCKMNDATDFTIAHKGEFSNDIEWRFGTYGATDDKIKLLCGDDSEGTVYIGRKYDTVLTSYEDSWIHLVATYSGSGASSGIKIYLNGVQVDDADYEGGSYTAMENQGEPVQIGRYETYYAEGSLKNVAIWSRALTATEVQNVMYKTYYEVSGRLASGLVSWWTLDATNLGTEEITDGGMESWTGNTPDNWSVDVVTVTDETTITYRGNHSLKMTKPNAQYKGIYQVFNGLTSTVTYQVDAWVLGDGVSALAIKVTDSAFSVDYWHTNASGTVFPASWTNVKYTFTSAVTDTSCRLIFMSATGVTAGTWYIDSVSLKPVTVEDLEGDNDGTVYGATVDTDLYGRDTPVKPRAIDNAPTVQSDAIGAGSAYFDVDNTDYIEIGDVELLTTAGSISAWVKIDSNANQCVIGKYESTVGNSRQYALNINTSKNPQWNVQASASSYASGTTATSSTVLSIGTWYHLCGTFSTSQAGKLYINGVLDTTAGSAIANAIDDTSETLKIGNSGDVRYFDGNICQVGIWDAVLTQVQIQSVMEKTFEEFTASEKTDLVSYWPLDEADGVGVVDKVDETVGSEMVDNLSEPADWTTQTNNTIGTSGDYVTCTWVDDAKGMKVSLSDAAALNSNLTVGKVYKMTFTAYMNTGSSTTTKILLAGSSYFDVATISTTEATHTVYWVGGHATNDVFFPFYGIGSGQIGYIKDISVKPVNGNTGVLL